MAKVSKSYVGPIVFLAGATFVCGVGVSIIGWLLISKIPQLIEEKDLTSSSVSNTEPFWWGGIGCVVPGFLGIAVGVSRNNALMISYLIFNILCLVVVGAMNGMVIKTLNFWLQIESSVANDWAGCQTLLNKCICLDFSSVKTWTMTGTTCEELEGIKGLLLGLAVLGCLCFVFALIGSCISCSSLCNQEEPPTTVIVQQQYPNVGNSILVQQNSNFGYPQQPLYPQGPYPQPMASNMDPPPYIVNPGNGYCMNDKASLMNNQVLM